MNDSEIDFKEEPTEFISLTYRAISFVIGCLIFPIVIVIFHLDSDWLTPFLEYVLLSVMFMPPILWYYAITGKSGFQEFKALNERLDSHKITIRSLVQAAVSIVIVFVYVIAIICLYSIINAK